MRSVPLTIIVDGSLGRRLIAPALPRFRCQHPDLQVHLLDRAWGSAAPDFTAAIRIGPIPDSEVVVQELGWIRTLTCASPTFIESKGAPTVPQHLASTECVAVMDADTGAAREWVFEREGARYDLLPRAPLAFSDADSAVAAAVRGAGYIRLSSIDVDQHIAAGLLEPVLEEWDESVPVSITVPRDGNADHALPALCAFVSALIPGPRGEERPTFASGHCTLHG